MLDKNELFAYPFKVETSEGLAFCSGMTLRDYFAAQALNGIITGLAETIRLDKAQNVAEVAYSFADAMLEARGKQ